MRQGHMAPIFVYGYRPSNHIYDCQSAWLILEWCASFWCVSYKANSLYKRHPLTESHYKVSLVPVVCTYMYICHRPPSCNLTCCFLGRVSAVQLGLRLAMLRAWSCCTVKPSEPEPNCKALCMTRLMQDAWHFMPTILPTLMWTLCFVNWCPLTLIPSLQDACLLVQVWDAVFVFIP